jgi:glycosyltransferase involved in cell wall biosynthesis
MAYNRKVFLIESIKSVLNQSVDRSNLEIIVIKNFEDSVIDKYCFEHAITNIIMEGTVGQYMQRGIEESSGEIIAFLEDDDIFIQTKVERLIHYKIKTNFNFIHNNYEEIDISGKSRTKFMSKVHLTSYNFDFLEYSNELQKYELKRMLKAEVDFNPSCIAISSDLGKRILSLISRVNAGQDSFLFCVALEYKSVVLVGEVLTKYRVHNSTSNQFENFLAQSRTLCQESKKQLESLSLLSDVLSDKNAIKILEEMILSRKIKLKTFRCGKSNLKLDEFCIFLLNALRSGNLNHIAWVFFLVNRIFFGKLINRFVFKLIETAINS